MLTNVHMIFCGVPGKGRRLKEVARKQGWWISVAMGPEQAIKFGLRNKHDLVIIDDFPASEGARSVFYQLQAAGKGPFLVLNDSPDDLRFSRLCALSFIRMITRVPEPADLVKAVTSLIESNRESSWGRIARPIPVKSRRSRPIQPASAEAGIGGICC